MADEIIGSAKVRISFDDLKNLDRQIDSTGRKFVGHMGLMESKTMRLSKAVGGLTGLFATIGVAKFGADVIGAATRMDSLNRMLVNVEGSQDRANARFKEFMKLAKEPVLDPMNLSKYYVGLKSVNVEAQLSIQFMKNLANAMAGVGASNEQFALAMEQFVQMAGKGKVMGDDLRAIANSFPQIRKYLTEALGTAIPEEIAKKGYTAVDVMTKLNDVMAQNPKFAGGAKAAQENFTQALDLFYASLGKNVLPAVTDFLNKLTNMMDRFNELSEGTKKVIGYGAMGAAGGVGLLGIVGALGAIHNQLGPVLGGLKGIAAVNIATSAASAGATPALSALFGEGAKGAGMGAGMSMASKVGGYAALGLTAAWVAKEIYVSATNAEIITTGLKEARTDYDRDMKALTDGLLKAIQGGKTPMSTPIGQTKAYTDWWYQQEMNRILYGSIMPSDKMGAMPIDKFLKMQGVEIPLVGPPSPPKTPKKDFMPDAEFLKKYGMPYFDEYSGLIQGLESYDEYKFKPKGSYKTPVPSKQIKPGPYMEGVFPFVDQLSVNMKVFGDLETQIKQYATVLPEVSAATQYLSGEMAKEYEKHRQLEDGIAEHNRKLAEQQQMLALSASEFDKNGVAVEDYAKALKFLKEDAKDVKKELMKDWSKEVKIGADLYKQIEKDWKDILKIWDKVDKKQATFWKNLEQMGLYSMDRIIDKGVGDLFDRLFPEEDKRRAIDDWNSWGATTGQAFDEFKAKWEADQQSMRYSWGDLTKDLLQDWTSMLLKMEGEALARDVYGMIRGKGLEGGSFVGSILGIGSGVSEGAGILAMTSGFGSVVGALAPLVPILAGITWLGRIMTPEKKPGFANKQDETIAPGRTVSQSQSGIPTLSQSEWEQWISTPASDEDQNGIKPFASGGVITKPTLALMGERGREYVFNEPQMMAIHEKMQGYENFMAKMSKSISMFDGFNTFSPAITMPNISITNQMPQITMPEISIKNQMPEIKVPAQRGGVGAKIENLNVNISLPNMNLESVNEYQLKSKIVPIIREAVQQGALS